MVDFIGFIFVKYLCQYWHFSEDKLVLFALASNMNKCEYYY